jgi:hypothetical protein
VIGNKAWWFLLHFECADETSVALAQAGITILRGVPLDKAQNAEQSAEAARGRHFGFAGVNVFPGGPGSLA